MTTAHAYPYLNLYLHSGTAPTLETHWLGFATGGEFWTGVTHALALAKEHRGVGWIADDRLLGAVHPCDLHWCFEEVLRALSTVGVRRFALLESEDAMNRRTINGMYQQAQPVVDFEVRRFTDLH